MKKLVLGENKKVISLLAFVVLALCLISSYALASDDADADGKSEAGTNAESESSLKIVIVDETSETNEESESSLKIVMADETPETDTESEDSLEEVADNSSIDESVSESEEATELETTVSENAVDSSGEKNLEKKGGSSKKVKESGNVLAAGRLNSNDEESISIISFQDTLKDMPEDAWDVSENQDGSVMAWVKQNEDSKELIVAGDGGVDANPDSSYLFSQYPCSNINFNDCFYTGNVLYMDEMFGFCLKLWGLDLNNWDTSNVISMCGMFRSYRGSNLDLNGWDTSNVTDMSYMFSGCEPLEELDVSGWDTSSVENMSNMFNRCVYLKEIDVSGWDTSSVTDMSDMFHSCRVENLEVSGWDTSKVTDMTNMFDGCGALGSLDVSGWDTSNVTNMADMFSYCWRLQSLDVSNWDTSNVTDMSYMFTDCEALENLEVSNWDTSYVTDMSYLFASCYALQGPDIREWDMTQADITGMLDGTGDKWEYWDISEEDSSTDTEIETFENNGSNSWSLAYIEQLFSDRDMPFSYERSEKYTVYDKIYCEGSWELTYYESGILDFAFAGANVTYDIAFYNDVTSGEGVISDVNGTKMVTATQEGPDDFNMSEQEIINDISEAEYGEDLLDIAHILYGSEFEKDIASIKEIAENWTHSKTEFSLTDAIVYTEENVSDNFNAGKLGETVNKIRYVSDATYPSVSVSKSEIVDKIVYTD